MTAPRDALAEPGAPARVIRGSTLRTTGYVLSVAANALVLPFLFRHLGVVESGRYVTVISLVTVLAGIVELGLTGVAVREYSVCPLEGRHALMRMLLAIRLTLFGAAAAAVVLFAVVAGYPDVMLAGVVLASTGIFLENIGSAYGVWMTANLRFGWQTITNVARQLSVAVLTAVLVVLDAPLVLFFAVFIPAGFAQLVLSVGVTRREIPHLPSFAGRAWRDLARASLPYVLAMGLNVVYFRVSMIAMSLIATPRETGWYGVAFRIVETLATLTGFVLGAALPLLARAAVDEPARYAYALRRILEVALLVGGGLTVATFVGAPVAIEVLAGEGFEPSIDILQPLAIVLLMKFASTALGLGLLARERFGDVLTANVVAVAVAGGVSAATIGALGADGAVLAALGSEAALIVGYLLALHRAGAAPALPLRTGIVVLVAGAVGCAVTASALPGLPAAVLAVAVYVVLVVLGGAVPPEVRRAVPRGRW